MSATGAEKVGEVATALLALARAAEALIAEVLAAAPYLRAIAAGWRP